MVKEYACKHCGYTLLLDEKGLKDFKLYCPSCNTRFVDPLVVENFPLKEGSNG
jgi:uncharacterized Zn finger protein (UPF0148 family)